MTREDLRAIHREFRQGLDAIYSREQLVAIDEHLTYLVEAIQDRPITSIERRRRAIAQRNRQARRNVRPALGRMQALS